MKKKVIITSICAIFLLSFLILGIFIYKKKLHTTKNTKQTTSFNMEVYNDTTLLTAIRKDYKVADIMPYYNMGKWGYSNKKGEIIIPCQFEECGFFSEGLAWAKIGNKVLFIDSLGKEVITTKYDKAANFHNSLGPIKKGNLWGFIDRNGNTVIEPQFEQYAFVGNDKIHVMQNHQWGIVDYKGKQIILPIYDTDFNFENGLAIVRRRGNEGLLNLEGKEVISCKYDQLLPIGKGFYIVEKKINYSLSQYGLSDNEGNMRIPLKYSKMENINGQALIVSDNANYGVINFRNDTLLPFKYKDLKWGNTNVLAAKGQAWGFISMKGDTLIPFTYYEASPFYDQLAIVKSSNGKFGMINIKEESVVPFEFNNIYRISNKLIKAEKNNLYGFFTSSGQKLLDCEYDAFDYHAMPSCSSGYIENEMNFNKPIFNHLIIGKNGKVGMINEKAEFVIPLKYHYIKSLDEHGIAVVGYKNLYGLVDVFGKELVAPIYQSIEYDEKSGYYFAQFNNKEKDNNRFRDKYINIGYFNFDGKLHSTSPYASMHHVTENEMIENIRASFKRVNDEVKSKKAEVLVFSENLKGYNYDNKFIVEDGQKKIKYEYYYDDKLNEYGPFFILITKNEGKTTLDRYYYIHGIIIRHVANDGTLQMIADAPYGPENDVHHQARIHLADFESAKVLSNKINNQRVEKVEKMCHDIDDKIAQGLYKKGDSDEQGMGEYQHRSEIYLDNQKNTIYSFESTSDECGSEQKKQYYTNGELIWSYEEGYEEYSPDNVGWYSSRFIETIYYYKGSQLRLIREMNEVTTISD